MECDDNRQLQLARQGKSGEPCRPEMSVQQNGVARSDLAKKKRCVSENFEWDLLEPVPRPGCTGIVTENDGLFRRYFQTRNRPLRANIDRPETDQGGSLRANKGHARREQWLRINGNDRFFAGMSDCYAILRRFSG